MMIPAKTESLMASMKVSVGLSERMNTTSPLALVAALGIISSLSRVVRSVFVFSSTWGKFSTKLCRFSRSAMRREAR